MKKFLLVFLLLGATFVGRSQVILNEIYNNPSDVNQEFFELYNTSFQDLKVDCYTLVIYYKVASDASNTGFIIMNLPDSTIQEKRWLTGSSANNINYQGKTAVKAGFNWSNLNFAGSTGYVKDFQAITKTVNKKVVLDKGYKETTIPNTLNPNGYADLFRKLQSGGELAVFLFNGSTYVNGFKAGFGTDNTIPQEIKDMSDLPVPALNPNGTGCAATSFTIKWADLRGMEYNTGGGSGGSDNGFARKFDGNCGSWVKTSSQINHTPNTTNGSATGESILGLFSSENILCGKTVSFTLTGAVNANDFNSFPITVSLYWDKNNNQTLDREDELLGAPYVVNSYSDIPKTFVDASGTTVDATGKNVIVTYATVLGCLDKVVVPTNVNPTLDASVKPVMVCGKRLDFTIGANSGFSLPIEVNLYPRNTLDADGNILSDTSNTSLGHKTITSLTNGTASGSINYSGDVSDFWVVYKSASSCSPTKPVSARNASGTITTTQNYLCNSIKFDITATGDAITYGGPMTVALYYDKNRNQQLDFSDTLGKALGSATVPALTGDVYSGTIVLPNNVDYQKDIFIIYRSANSCFDPYPHTQDPANDPTPRLAYYNRGPLEVNGELAGKTVTYFVVSGNKTNPEAFPMTIKVYEDKDVNGIINTGDSLLITDILNTEDYSNHTIKTGNLQSLAIITASSNLGCASDIFAISSNLAPLPVTFKSFTAVRKDANKVSLSWVTATEQNNRGFYVQRNQGSGWKDAGFVFSAAPEGNSSTELQYSLTDNNPHKGVTQYRILQVDLDGKGHYSVIRYVNGQGTGGRMQLFPNPSNTGAVTLLFDTDGLRDVLVADVAGRAVQQQKGVVGNTIKLNNLPSGFYTVQVRDSNAGTVTTEKFVIKKR